MVAQHYLLPCACGKKNVVDPGIAGSTITCQCGATLQVPKLRELRLLEPESQSLPTQVYATRGTRPLGCLFGALLSLALIAMVVTAGALFLRSRIDISWNVDKDLAEGDRQIDRMAVDQAYEVWKNFADSGLGPAQPPAYVLNLQMADLLWHIAIVAGGVLGLCVFLAAAVAVMDARKLKS